MIFEFLLHICFMDNGCIGNLWGVLVCFFFEANEMCGNPSSCSRGVCYCVLVLEITLPSFLFWLASAFPVSPGMRPSLESGESLALSAVETKGFLSSVTGQVVCSFAFVERKRAMWTYGGSLTCWFSPPSQTGYICFPKNENSTCKTISGLCGFRYHWIIYGGAQPLT